MKTVFRLMIVVVLGLSQSVAARTAPDGLRLRENLTPGPGVFLVARRDLPSPYFSSSVILLLRHDATGTLGVMVNRRTRFRLQELLPDLQGVESAGHPVLIGGPVAGHTLLMLIRRASAGPGIEAVTGEIAYSREREVLEALIARKKPAGELRVYAGHAGWAAGQLDYELARGDWHLTRADAESVFGDEEERLWQRLIDKLDPPGIWVQRCDTWREAWLSAEGRADCVGRSIESGRTSTPGVTRKGMTGW